MNRTSPIHHIHNTAAALGLLLCTLLLSCKGEDRSHEYEELTAHNNWMLTVMQDKYLWGDQLQEPTYKSYFYPGTQFFSTLTSSQKDTWSYCLVDSAITDPHTRGNFNHLDTYGIDFTVINDPTKTTSRSFARVTHVVEGSPAAQAGLRRNSFISIVDDTRITSSNASKYLVNGKEHSIVFHHLDTLVTDSVEPTTYIWTDSIEATLPASRYVEEKAFPVAKVFDIYGINIAYLMATRLVPYPDEQQTSGNIFLADLDAKMQAIMAFRPAELVLDLRLCNYGTIEMAQRLASYIVPTALKDRTFLKTKWNDRYAANNTTYTYDTTIGSLELPHIYIITGTYTQGAAEWLIKALQQTLGHENVTIIGTATKGQNVMTQYIASGYGHQLYPAVAYVTDESGDISPTPITPTYTVNETANTYLLYMNEYGDPNEILFAYCLAAMFAIE